MTLCFIPFRHRIWCENFINKQTDKDKQNNILHKIQNLWSLPHKSITMKDTGNVFVLIFNIPTSLHTKSLRNFFSELLENSAFQMFHYRHRPMDKAKVSKTLNTVDEGRYYYLLVSHFLK